MRRKNDPRRLIADYAQFGEASPMSNRLKHWRKTVRGFSRKKLAGMAGCHEQTIRKLEDGTLKLDEEWRNRLAPLLRIKPEELLGNSVDGVSPVGVRLVPVISWTVAGAPVAVIEQNIDEDTERVASTWPTQTLLALPVLDSSIDRQGGAGSIAVYDYADCELVDGRFYVYRLNGEKGIRRYRETGGPRRFEPDSTQEHATIFPNGEVKVLGRVVEIIKRMP